MTAAGAGLVEVVRLGPRSAVARARAHSPLRFVMPRNAGRAAWIYVANFGGGLVNGDRITLSIDVGAGAAAVLLSQGSTKIYRSPDGTHHDFRATVAGSGVLVAMPERVACYAGARYRQTQRIELAPAASAVIVDCVTAGRVASGERWAFDRYEAAMSVSRDGSPVLADRIVLDQGDGSIAARMRRFDAFASILLTGPAAGEAAARADARVQKRTVSRGMEFIATSAPLADGGSLIRLAACSVAALVDEIAAIVRPAVASLGDDPALYRW